MSIVLLAGSCSVLVWVWCGVQGCLVFVGFLRRPLIKVVLEIMVELPFTMLLLLSGVCFCFAVSILCFLLFADAAVWCRRF